MRRPGQVLSRYDLLEGAWEIGYENRSNVVDVYVRYLREKIDRPFGAETHRDRARRRLPPARGSNQRTAGYRAARKRDPHVGAALRAVPGVGVAAVGLGDRLDDRQAEPAPLRARARLLAAAEALERPPQRARR